MPSPSRVVNPDQVTLQGAPPQELDAASFEPELRGTIFYLRQDVLSELSDNRIVGFGQVISFLLELPSAVPDCIGWDKGRVEEATRELVGFLNGKVDITRFLAPARQVAFGARKSDDILSEAKLPRPNN